MPKALVTGATGFVGAAVLRELLARGWAVRALHRPGSDLRHLEGDGRAAERVVGNLREPASLRRAMEGCDHVFHVAARYAFGFRHKRDLELDNRAGTQNVLAVARELGVEKVVYTSTVGILHPRADGEPVDERALARPHELAGPYKRSKWLAEQEVLRAAAEGLSVVSVCPTAPVGPGDVKPTPTGRMVLDFIRGRMPAFTDTGLNLVAVEDVARGQALAAERGRPGERYILGAENLSLREILGALSRICGRPVPRVRIPRRLLVPLAWGSEAAAAVLRRDPRLSLENARMSQSFMYFETRKARDELGFEPTCVVAALERAVSWFDEQGYP